MYTVTVIKVITGQSFIKRRYMPYISRKSRKYILLFTLAIAVAVLYMLINRTFLVFMDFDSIIYICLTVVWIITIQRRMTIGNLRHYIVLGGSFMISLFIMRLIRWTFYSGILILERLFWYFYYVSSEGRRFNLHKSYSI